MPISREEFDEIAPGDIIHVSKNIPMPSVGIEVEGGYDWVVINRYVESVSVELTNQTQEVSQVLNNRTVINRNYIDKLVYHDPNAKPADDTNLICSVAKSANSDTVRSSVDDQVTNTEKAKERAKKITEYAKAAAKGPKRKLSGKAESAKQQRKERVSKAIRMYNDGESDANIASTLGISRNTLNTYLTGHRNREKTIRQNSGKVKNDIGTALAHHNADATASMIGRAQRAAMANELYKQNHPISEIATFLGVKPSTVRGYVHLPKIVGKKSDK